MRVGKGLLPIFMMCLILAGCGGTQENKTEFSTTSALVCAAGGMKVAKHGNRAASSKCGTADCLEALGVNIEQSPGQCVRLLEETGICFFFAQKYHTSMKYVAQSERNSVSALSSTFSVR